MQRIRRKGRSPLAGDSARSHRLQAGSSKSRESPLESEPAQSSFRPHGSGAPGHISAPTGREPRATSDPRGTGCPRAQNAGGAAWAARITGAVRSPQTPTPAPSGCLDSVRLPRPDPVRGIKRDGAVIFLRIPAHPATGHRPGEDCVWGNPCVRGGGPGAAGSAGGPQRDCRAADRLTGGGEIKRSSGQRRSASDRVR